MKKCIIEGFFAVGMHHHGNRSLQIGAGYRGYPDPNNRYDDHAFGIYEYHGQKLVAYLRRSDARLISELFFRDLIEGPVVIKPKFEPVYRARVGPSQRCNLGFHCKENNMDKISNFLCESHILVRFI